MVQLTNEFGSVIKGIPVIYCSIQNVTKVTIAYNELISVNVIARYMRDPVYNINDCPKLMVSSHWPRLTLSADFYRPQRSYGKVMFLHLSVSTMYVR